MLPKKKYKFNPQTLAYELHRTPLKVHFSRGFVLFLLSIVAAVGCYQVYTRYLGLETPKTLTLKRQNAELLAKLDLMNRQIGEADQRLERLKRHDNQVYRPIFGMEEISDDERNAGFGGVDRYSHLGHSRHSRFLTNTAVRFDQLYKKTSVQSRSFDLVERMAAQTDQMAAHIPAILPVNHTESSDKFRLSSSFGMRKDPVWHDIRMHYGIDITGPAGSPVYATGNGTVVKRGFSYFGYGNFVVIDHGFGYQTRYAHLKSISVLEGQKINRGECIGLLGSTGKSLAPHVHYEVLYRDRHVNPYNYYNSDIGSDEYDTMTGFARGQL